MVSITVRGIILTCLYTSSRFRQAYEHSVKDVLSHLVGYSQPSHMAYLGSKFSMNSQPPSPNMDHLSCFYPGMLALGVYYEVQSSSRDMAANLTHTCYYMYNSTSPTGLAPEMFQFNTNPQGSSDVAPSSVSLVKCQSKGPILNCNTSIPLSRVFKTFSVQRRLSPCSTCTA